jgi:RNA recognition motif-containing protein
MQRTHDVFHLYVANFPDQYEIKDIRSIFERFGEIESLKVIKNGDNKSFALIEFKSQGKTA